MSTITETVSIDTSPTRVSGAIAISAAVIAVVTSTLVSMLALIFGILGILGVAAGVTIGSRAAVSFGIIGLVGGLIIGGLLGSPVMLVIIGMVGIIIAWDLGHHSIDLGEQLGRSAPTIKGELFHAGGSVLVGAIAAGIIYAVFMASPTEQPISALIFIVLGAVFFAWVIRT